MVKSLPRKVDIYFLTEFLNPRWNPTNTVGFDPTAEDSTALYNADSFDKVSDRYPQFTVQDAGVDAATETTYDYLTSDGPGQNRDGTLTAQIRVEDTQDGYTADSNTYNAVNAERLATLIRQEIERICIDNPTGGDTEFSFVGSTEDEIGDTGETTERTRRAACTISYGWLRD